MATMSATKANAGGVAGALVVLVLYALNQVPFIADMPPDPKGALVFLLSAGIGYALVYYAPPNKPYSEPVPGPKPDSVPMPDTDGVLNLNP